jgi:hypothetical protein
VIFSKISKAIKIFKNKPNILNNVLLISPYGVEKSSLIRRTPSQKLLLKLPAPSQQIKLWKLPPLCFQCGAKIYHLW